MMSMLIKMSQEKDRLCSPGLRRVLIMEQYKNLGGDSGVTAFEIGDGSITVYFNDGSQYLYTNQSAGPGNITEMQRLARAGQGLNSFINRVVKHGYARKLR
jgi:hypothetical protein